MPRVDPYFSILRGQPTPPQRMQGHTESVWASAFFKDGRQVVTGSWDSTLRIWDVEKKTLIGQPFQGHCGRVRSVAVSPNNRWIASGGDKTIIWDVKSRQMVFELVKHTQEVNSVCFSPDGKKLASGSNDGTAVVWDVETGAVLATLPHDGSVWCVAFSPDGLKLASGSSGRTIQIWLINIAQCFLKFHAHHRVRSVVWSPDAQQLISAADDKTVRFWNSSNGAQIDQPCTGHTDSIYSLAISSDGSFIATASDDKTVRMWSTETHQQIGRPLEHPDPVYCVAISCDGGLLVSGDVQGKVWFRSTKDVLKQGKAEERIENDEDAQRLWQQSLSCTDTQLYSHNNNSKLTSDHSNSSNHPSETYEASGSDVISSLSDILTWNTCIAGDLNSAKELLTQEIDEDVGSHYCYAIRSTVRARIYEWDTALQDAVKSIGIRPLLFGYISKGIALCGNKQFSGAVEAFDLAFTFSEHDFVTTELLFLIKTVALFNAGYFPEALQRVKDLATAHQRLTLPCNVVDSYLHMQLAQISFEEKMYDGAAEDLTDIITNIADSFLPTKSLEPTLKIFTLLFGWDVDSLWRTVNQRRCNAFLHADRVIKAVESLQYMMSVIDEADKDSCAEWSVTFKEDCIARCVTVGDKAIAAGDYDMAIELYSVAIGLDSLSQTLFAQRSKAKLGRNLYEEALHDAEKVIELDPSSYLGYELKHEAIEAMKTTLPKLDDASDARLRKLRQQYLSPTEVEDGIKRAIQAHLENAPLRLLDTSTGLLCDREAQINAFMENTEYKKLVSSSMAHARLQTQSIQEEITKFFSWVMLSHRWERKEPLLHDIQGQDVYDLYPVGTNVKLRMFCNIARDAGYRWAWSDTCCIDQNNNVEVQRSVNSMFIWYRQSALTIVYLSDVPPSAKSGALANSVWNTRGWTVQEFLAPYVVLFYQNDWTLYLNDHSLNHKDSVTIMQELEDSTGINAQALVAFRPGMTGAREKLQWASTRVTTLQEDIAYSLFGIFRVHLPVIYGETKQNALGRLIQEIIARSGDITALDWVGKSSEFNSCLPANISSYKTIPYTMPLHEDEMQISVSRLQNTVAVESASNFYTLLCNVNAPRFANSRLQLPCIVFPVTAVRRRHGQEQETCFTYDVKADGLQDLLITTEDKLTQFLRARSSRQLLLLVRPWNRHDLELPDLEDDAQSADDWSEPESPSSETLSGYPGEDEPVDSESHPRALRLIARLGQPFSAFLLAQQRGGEYKRIASDHSVIAQVKDMASVDDMTDIRTLEIL